ncbi:MAG TPA: hypothetical protein VFZ66_03500 [Herpetosiphonaceae bacterium]
MSPPCQLHAPSGCAAPSSIATCVPGRSHAHPPTIPPHVLAIGSTGLHAALRAAGVAVSPVPTLLDGYDRAVRRLAAAAPPRLTLILLDLHAHAPGFPELAAPQLAAVLAEQMTRGALHPAWLIGLTSTPAPDLDAEAYLAGCHLVLHRPLTPAMRARLARLATYPAALPPTDRATQAYQRAALRVVHAVEAAQVPLWSAADVALLLGWLTPYPLRRATRAQPQQQAAARRLVRALGGARAAHRRLHQIAASWRVRAPLHAEVLTLFLQGWERRAIVRSYVDRGLYEDTRIYIVINELPQRIAAELRLAQAREEDA